MNKLDKNSYPVKYQFTNVPIELTMEDYTKARKEFVDHISSDPGVVAIYQIGSVTAPGLSDLDFIVVLNDKRLTNVPSFFSISNLGQKSQYVLMHEQFFVDRLIMKELPKLTAVFNMKKVYGEDVDICQLEGAGQRLLTQILLNDIVVVALGHEYATYLDSNVLDVRLTLARMNSLKYPVNMFAALSGIRNENWEACIDDFAQIRSQWFELSTQQRYEALGSCLHGAACLADELVNQLDDFNRKNNFFEIDKELRGFGTFRLGSNTLTFGNPADYKMDDIETTTISGQILPVTFLLQLKEYTKENGPVSSFIRRNLRSRLAHTYSSPHRKLIMERINLVDTHISFLEKNRFMFGSMFNFGYQLSPCFYTHLVKRLRQKIVKLKKV